MLPVMGRRVVQDTYFKKAKAEGYVARSAYKLIQLQEARRLIRRGDRVLDLGCAPGAWLQVATELVGPKGLVVGLDLQPARYSFDENVHYQVGDVNEVNPADLLERSGKQFDVVLSDMAPKTTGVNEHELSVRLCDRVLELAPEVLRGGGNLAMKVFEGAQYPELLERTKSLFAEAKGYKPKASRSESREMYIVAKGFRGV